MSNKRKQQYLTNHAVMLYMEELGAKVVAQSGIPGDRYHIGKLIMHSLNEDPDFISQIDAGAKEPDNSETNGSVLARSIRCAIAYKKLGLKVGDVIAIIAPNHIDLAIAVYGAQYIGVTIAGMDVTFNANELKHGFVINEPKVVLCQIDKTSDIEEALKLSKTDAVIVTFDKGSKFTCFSDFIGNVSDQEFKDFKPADFDTETTLVMLASTSGSTGLPKSVMHTHKNMTLNYPQFMVRFYEFPTATKLDFMVSPLQWLSAALKYFMSPILKFTRLQTSRPVTRDHIYEIINKYKPTSAVFSPALMTSLLAPGDRDQCDFSCFEVIQVGESLVTSQLVNTIKEVMPNAEMEIIYGLSELGKALSWDSDVPLGSVGRAMGYSRYRLVDPVTFEDIDEPNVAGELWCKGPTVSPGYYKNPEATRAAYTDDGWLKTGDLFYRDKNYCYYFVERWRTLIKYKSYHVSPSEVEQVIRTHPSVFDVAVVGVPDDECGDLPAAAVVLHKRTSVTAQEIKDLVAESLADSKRLRGGVVFMEEFPLTVTTKLDRQKLKKMVAEMERE